MVYVSKQKYIAYINNLPNCHFSIYSLYIFVWIQYFWGPPLNCLISETVMMNCFIKRFLCF